MDIFHDICPPLIPVTPTVSSHLYVEILTISIVLALENSLL